MKHMIISIFLCTGLSSSIAWCQTKVALVVGNNAYVRLPSLGTAVNDALSVGAELGSRGFTVIQAPDSTFADFESAKSRFLKQIANGGIGVFYFAGHGIQVEGRNYVLPVDFTAGAEKELADKGISIPGLLDQIEAARPKLAILILDACRDNPFVAPETRGVRSRGLAELGKPIPGGTLIIYSASSNQSALDSVPGQASKNSLFTTELLSAVKEANLEIRDLARRVRFSVMERAKTAGFFQVPALYDNLGQGEFYFSISTATGQKKLRNLPPRIRLIIPFAANAPTDSMVRAIAPRLASALGSELNIENQIDIVGDKVAESVGSAAKDGSVLLLGNFVQSSRRELRGDNNLEPIGILADVPLNVASHPNVRASSIQELVSSAKSLGKPWNMGAALVGSVEDMCARQLQKKLGADIINVTNIAGGLGPTIASLQRGQFDLVCTTASIVAPQAASKNLRLVAAVRSSTRAAGNLAVVPTAAAQGFDIVAPNWLGVFGPRGLQVDAIERISEAMKTVLATTDAADIFRIYGALTPSSEDASPRGLKAAIRLGSTLQTQ